MTPFLAAQSANWQIAVESVSESVLQTAILFVVLIPFGMVLFLYGSHTESAKDGASDDDDYTPEAWATAAEQVIALRGEMREWLTDEAYALRVFIWDVEQLPAPDFTTGLSAVEAAYEAIERLKIINAKAIAGLAARDEDDPVDPDLLAIAQAQWDEIKRICAKANELASTSPFYRTGYRSLAAPAELPTPASHRISQD